MVGYLVVLISVFVVGSTEDILIAYDDLIESDNCIYVDLSFYAYSS